jgi:hypothetical protein
MPELTKSSLVRDVSTPTLLHADLHMRNIFVSEAAPFDMTGIIDWQGTAVEPAFIYADETPDFASREVEDEDEDGTTEPSESNDNPSSSPSQIKTESTKANQDILLCNQAFEICMHGYASIIAKARNITDEIQVLLWHCCHCNTSWRDSAPGIRQELLEFSAQWESAGFGASAASSCPYVLTMEELAMHREQYADFETALSLKLGLMRSLRTDSDGWVASGDWDVVKPAHDEMFGEWLLTAEEDDDLDEEKARELWLLDHQL